MVAPAVDPVALLEELLGIDSANPAMGGPGERAVAEHLATLLEGLGCRVSMPPGAGSGARPNLVAVLPGAPGRPVLLLEAHLDTVAQPRRPIPVRRDGGRIHGRGACDTKGSAAAMVATVARVAARPDRPTLVFAGAADEEVAMAGSRALVDQLAGIEGLPPVAGAIVGEPTSLAPVRVHNGIMRFTITARGRAAHTSRAHLGVNAVAAAARAVLIIEDELVPALRARSHPLAGPALATAAVIRGGIAPNLVPEWCEVEVDRRLAPGEDPAEALAGIDRLLERLRAAGDDLAREEPSVLLAAVETAADHPLVRVAEEAVEAVTGRRAGSGGVPYGTDASHLSGVGGIPCLVLGPGSIDQAHTEDEWVAVDEVEDASRIYEEMVLRFVAVPAPDPAREEGGA